jgi:nucleotide-binding universal stress UspA family protein
MTVSGKILVATDFSENSERACEVAVDWAERFGAELHWAHSFEHMSDVVPPGALPLMTSYIEKARHSGVDRLRGWVGRSRERGIESQQHDLEAPIAASIVDCAREISADCIVVGAHGHEGLGQVMRGSIADRVIRNADCNVLVVRGPVSPVSDRPVVLGDELSIYGGAAREDALALARALDVDIHAVHGINLGIPYFATLEVLLPKEIFEDAYAEINSSWTTRPREAPT